MAEFSNVVQLVGYVVSVDPKITVIPNFLSSQECTALISMSERIGFVRSLVGRGTVSAYEQAKSDALENNVSPNRTSLSVTLDVATTHDSVERDLCEIRNRLAEIVKLPVTGLEPLVVVKYESGQFFKLHHDGSFRPYTVFIYLNGPSEQADDSTINNSDSPTGGETRFPEIGIRIRPRMGTAVVWRNSNDDGSSDNRLVHEGLPPIGWTKYGVNCFFNEALIESSSSNVENVNQCSLDA